MKISVDMSGINKAISALKKTGAAGGDVIERVVADTTLTAHRLAVMGIQRGPASGATYVKTNPRRTHTASAPGQYPMSDTGYLATNVRFEFESNGPNGHTGFVGTNVVYGLYLETGTSRMAARPWLARSVQLASAKIADDLVAKMKAAT